MTCVYMSAVLESRQLMHYTPERQNLSLFDCIVPVTTSSAVTNQCNVVCRMTSQGSGPTFESGFSGDVLNGSGQAMHYTTYIYSVNIFVAKFSSLLQPIVSGPSMSGVHLFTLLQLPSCMLHIHGPTQQLNNMKHNHMYQGSPLVEMSTAMKLQHQWTIWTTLIPGLPLCSRM